MEGSAAALQQTESFHKQREASQQSDCGAGSRTGGLPLECWAGFAVAGVRPAFQISNFKFEISNKQVAFGQDFLRHRQDKSKSHQCKQRRRNSSTLRCGFAPPAPKYPFTGCFPAEPISVSSGDFRLERFRREAANFLQVCSVLVIFEQSLSFHFVYSKERNIDGRGRRRVDSRKTSDTPFRPCSKLSPVWFRNVMPVP